MAEILLEEGKPVVFVEIDWENREQQRPCFYDLFQCRDYTTYPTTFSGQNVCLIILLVFEAPIGNTS